MQYILSRNEFQPCPGKVGEWSTWSNCDRSCDNGIRIRTRGCFDKNGNQLGIGTRHTPIIHCERAHSACYHIVHSHRIECLGKDSGWCVEDEREIQMCNLDRCNDELWFNEDSGRSGDIWSAWSDWDNCNDDDMKTRTRLCNFSSGNCAGIDSFGGPSRIVLDSYLEIYAKPFSIALTCKAILK